MMRIIAWLLQATWVGVLLCPNFVVGQDLPRQHHPWGRFHPDSWKQVRVLNETLSPDGAVMLRGVSETTTRLVSVDAEGYTLKVDVVVDVDGKRFASPSQTIWHGYFGQRPGQTVQVKKTGDTQLTVAGKRTICEQRTVVISDAQQRRTAQIAYSPDVSPFTLRREVTTADDTKIISEVVAFDHDVDVLGVHRPTSKVKTVATLGKNSLSTIETMCDDVPGGVVSHSSQETDEQGRVIRRSTLELLSYEAVECPQPGDTVVRRRSYSRREARRDARRD